ncbi:response regulator transcription factor [Chamaesiphon minutus]|uniref:Response regulator with CheY-like receiver domain and winged-helix DNA-binding domain n=1 Tax=Chamaesiphon minutus (strain ATCC 27169 / PCC 6605) TaxID=1173020 RepID=K9U9X2_CHAP6|nr:response regulator [Chamaesiphon minutus]AFY91403.1 response regulator with CheY-like receiver domain and winged-helix DNA-binding domain [Chamaesiphon minutus PCC 6605]
MKSVVSGGRSNTSRILIVDDSSEILSVTDAILTSAGYETISYTDGLIALQIIELLPPDLIILDINMPTIDGYEMTRRIRSNSKWDLTPILLFTALDPAQAALGLECGADDLLGKPIAIEELLGKVSLLLHSRYRQQLRAG